MKFEYIGTKKNTNAYNIVAGLNPGDIISLTGHQAKRAQKRPDFKEVANNKKVTITPEQAQKIWDEQKKVPPETYEIAALKAQLDALQRKMEARAEGETSVDDAFMEPAEIDD